MALITCPECEREVSDKAAACPNCGYPFASVEASAKGQQGESPADEDSVGAITATPSESEAKSKRSVPVSLLVVGVLLVAVAALWTDLGGAKTKLLELTGAAPPTIRSEDAVRNLFIRNSDLFDPHSAMFRNLTYTDSDILNDIVWCGEVNAKNRMGAYVGWTKFSATKSKTGAIDVSVYANVSDNVRDMLYDMHCERTYPAPETMPLEQQ